MGSIKKEGYKDEREDKRKNSSNHNVYCNGY